MSKDASLIFRHRIVRRRVPARDGDRVQAWSRIHEEIQRGSLLPASAYPCTDCGRRHRPGDPPFHHDHHRGYSGATQLAVQPVCPRCHRRRSAALITHCPSGHPYTLENTYVYRGGRYCRHCARNRRRLDRRERERASLVQPEE